MPHLDDWTWKDTIILSILVVMLWPLLFLDYKEDI